ncbi:hypothetical protein M0657_000569 [Pyricularia oryzae]|uniref:Uncharacterized protein n=2 Tax=Pyricularia oryzae TaxID=318829 RepID=A0AA97PPH8_PYRO3|nr:hypothetical protein OOU_Y34scaffold00228g3 [Pyricularia oryzae Y34]KAI7930905.1 hypothetical protein M9X92_000585 [Pyricularia oryzae]KAI7932439.1 hypothetical protein M0657_000569 [Pyricularia oryzae]
MSSIPFRSWPPAPRPTPTRPEPRHNYITCGGSTLCRGTRSSRAKTYEYERCFKHGYKTIKNPGTALERGLYALIDSLYLQVIVEEVTSRYSGGRGPSTRRRGPPGSKQRWLPRSEFELERISNDKHFGADQLAIILNKYGRRHMGTDLALGLVIPGEEPNILDVIPDAPAHAEADAILKKELPVRVIWVTNDNMELPAGGVVMSHYEGMKPLTKIEAARDAIKKRGGAAAAAHKANRRRHRNRARAVG